jgi:phosphomevalonate kinase
MPEAHAPGKLVICGEYAALRGAAAIAMAVAVRARARVNPAATDASRLELADGGASLFDWDGGLPRWRQSPPAGQGRILEAVTAALVARGVCLDSRLDIRLDTRDFSTTRRDGRIEKLGLGSSAAITVALTAALLAQAGHGAPGRAALLDLCMDAHRRFQEGRGSGVDVATSIHGGVITLATTPDGMRARALAWPPGLHWIGVWSGASASTGEMLARFEAFHARDAARFGQRVEELRELAAVAVAVWERGDVAAILQALADYDDALRALDDGAGMGIYTPAHQRLAQISGAAGAVYKISGAGGGDFGIAFADSPEVIARAAAAFAGQGALTLAGATPAPGVTLS